MGIIDDLDHAGSLCIISDSAVALCNCRAGYQPPGTGNGHCSGIGGGVSVSSGGCA